MAKVLTTEKFIQKAKKIHGDKYDYSRSSYQGGKLKIEIICKIHGSFSQIASNHLMGAVCKKCSYNLRSKIKLLNTDQFIKRVEKIHNYKYDYSLVNYENTYGNINIICKEHGVFNQRANDHINGCGCPICKKELVSNKLRADTSIILEKCNKIHNNKYIYNFDKYKNNKCKISITCNKHGVFLQSINSHLKGRGCPKCKNIVSNPEIEVQDFVKSLGLKIKTNDRKFLENGQELDIIIHSKKLAIEFNGIYWHYDTKNSKGKVRGYHSNKSKICKSKNYVLLHLREDLWNYKKEHMKNVIKKLLNI